MFLREDLSKKLLTYSTALGIFLLLLGVYFFFFKHKEKTDVVQEKPKEEDVSLHTQGNPTKLLISGVKIDLPIIESKIVDGVWETTQEGVSHLDISANPGEDGNIVLYGHNKKRLIGSLPYVSMGAKIQVVTDDGVTHNYKVYSKRKVEDTDVSIALDTPSEVLTIYTCDEENTKRFVLQAKPV